MASLREKRVWDVADFAEHAGIGHMAARRLLLKLDAKHGGRLLTPTSGANRKYTFRPVTLRKLEPEYFESVESLEFRIEELEEAMATTAAALRRLSSQVGANTRQIVALLEAAARASSRAAPPASRVRTVAPMRRVG